MEIEVLHFITGQTRPQLRKVENDLTPLQDLVGGLLEMVRMRNGLVLWCNEEGLIRKLPVGFAATTTYGIIPVRGNFFVCRLDGSEFASIRPTDHVTVNSDIISVT